MNENKYEILTKDFNSDLIIYNPYTNCSNLECSVCHSDYYTLYINKETNEIFALCGFTPCSHKIDYKEFISKLKIINEKSLELIFKTEFE